MLTPGFSHITAPALVVDLGIFTMRALLYVPGKGPQEQYGFLLPSPECTLNERIHNCTVNRRPLYMVGICMGLTPLTSLRAHLAAGFDVTMHPETAEAMTSDPGKLEAMGIKIQRKIPANASHVQAMDFDAYFWNTLCDMAELPRPEVTVISAADYGRPLDYDPSVGRSVLLADFFDGWMEPRDLSIKALPSEGYHRSLLRLAAIQQSTGVPSLDFATSFLFGMLSLPGIAEMSAQREVLLLHVGEHFMEAFLVFDNKLYAFLELPFKGPLADNGLDGHNEAVLQKIIEDYYSGDLTEEWVRERGGCLWRAPSGVHSGRVLCPVFSAGSRAPIMEPYSKVMGLQMDSVMITCWGLLNAYNRFLSNRNKV